MSASDNHVGPDGKDVQPTEDTGVPTQSRVSRRQKRRRHRRQIIGAVSVLVLLGAAGAVIISRTPASGRRPDQTTGGKSGEGTTSTASAAAAASRHLAPGVGDLFIQPSVAAYLAANAAEDVTAAVYDDVTGRLSLYRPGVAQDTASIMKVDILATLLAQGQAKGQPLTAADQALATSMIEESDNDDAQDLWDDEGGATAVQSFDVAAGLTQTTPDAAGYWGLSTTTAADQVQLLRTVVFPNDVLTPASQSYELGLMSNIEADQAWGVSAGPGTDAHVALKNGWLPLDAGGWQVNSIGYIDGAGRNYVIAVLTEGATEATGISTIQGLSSLIWGLLAPSAS